MPRQYLASQNSSPTCGMIDTGKPLIVEFVFLYLGLPVTRRRATMATRVARGLETVPRTADRSIAMGGRGVLRTSRGQTTRQLSSQIGMPSGTYPGTSLEIHLAVRRRCSTRPVVPAAATPATFAVVDAGGVGAGEMTVETAAGTGI